MIAYRLTVSAIDGPWIKISWGDELGHIASYTIGRQMFVDFVKDCRQALSALAETYRTEARPYGVPLLRELARAGSALYNHLFRAAPQEQELADMARQVWEGDRRRKRTLTIAVSEAAQAPWGVIFEDDPDDTDDDVDPKNWKGFWSIRYRLGLIYEMRRVIAFHEPRSRERFRTLFVFNRDAYEQMLSNLDDERRDTLDRLIALPVGPVFTSIDCKRIWTELADHNCVILFLVHASGKKLSLKNDDVITVDKFLHIFRRQTGGPLQPSCLVFLNGCNTAVGELDHGYLTATWRPGFCGFIGTEVDTPLRLAACILVDFMELVVECGASVQEAIDRIRVEHWPVSLIYSAYAHPDFRVEAI